MVRPSISRTLISSSLNETWTARSSAGRAEVLTPCLHEILLTFLHNLMQDPQLSGIETHRVQPELCRHCITVDMHMCRLVRLMTVKIKTVRPVLRTVGIQIIVRHCVTKPFALSAILNPQLPSTIRSCSIFRNSVASCWSLALPW